MADIRLSDDQFDAIIKSNGPRTKQLIKRLNDDELSYLQVRAEAHLGEAKNPKEGGTAMQSAANFRKMGSPEEEQKGASATGSGSLFGAVIDPSFYKGALQNAIAAGQLGGPNVAGMTPGAQEYVGRMGKQHEETGIFGFPPAVDPHEAKQAGIDPAATMLANVPTSAANLGAGLGVMAGKGVEAVGKAGAGAGAELLGSMSENKDLEKKGQEWGKESVEATELLTGMVGEVALHGLWNVPKSVLKTMGFGIADAIGLEHYAMEHGITPNEFLDYMQEDPVGTALFVTGWLNGAVKIKAKALKASAPKAYMDPMLQKGEGVKMPIEAELDPNRALPKDPTAVIEPGDIEFKDTGRPFPEAHYKLSAEVEGPQGRNPAGSRVSASYLKAQGFDDIGLQLDRRAARPSQEAYNAKRMEMFRELANERQGILDDNRAGKLTAEEHAQLWEQSERLTKDFFKNEFKAERAERQRVIQETGLVEEKLYKEFQKTDSAEVKQMIKEAGDLVGKEHARLKRIRNAEVDAILPEEITAVAKKYPVAWNSARNHLIGMVDRAREGVSVKWKDFKKALYDEMSLIYPKLTRKEIRSLNTKKGKQYQEMGSLVDPEVAWMLDEIASARARRGQSNTPISAPVGRWSKTKVGVFDRYYNNLQKFYEADIKAGDQMSKPKAVRQSGQTGAPNEAKDTRQFGRQMPGEIEAPVEYVGDRGGVEMWQWMEDTPQMPKGKMVSTKFLEDMGYKIERPTMPKANGRQKAKLAPEATEAEMMVEETITNDLPDHQKGNVYVQNDTNSALKSMVQGFLDFTRPVTAPLLRLPGGQGLLTKFNQWAAAAQHSGVMTTLKIQKLTRSLSEAGKRSKKFVEASKRRYAQYLHDQKRQAAELRKDEAKAIKEHAKAKKEAGEKLTKNELEELKWAEQVDVDITIPEMDAEVLRLFRESEEFAIIDRWYRKDVQPYIEEWAEAAGITSELYTPDGLYVKSSYVTDLKGFEGDWTKLRFIEAEFGRQQRPYARTMTKAQASRTFKGYVPEGMVINEDLGSLVNETLRDRMTNATKRIVMDEIQRYAHDKKKFKSGQRVHKGKKSYVLKKVNLEKFVSEKGSVIKEDFLVPEEIANSFDWINKDHYNTKAGRAVQQWQGVMTGMALLTPAEATMHAMNFIHAGARLAGEGLGRNVKARAGANYGPLVGGAADILTTYGTQLGRISGLIYDMSGLTRAELVSYTERLSAVGGLRTYGIIPKQYRPKSTRGPVSKAVQWAHELPVMHSLRESVFGMPEKGGGFKGLGLETRARISIFKALEKMEPGKSDAYYGNILNNYLGTYSKNLLPHLTEVLKNVDPFARAGTGMAKSGVMTFGKDMIVDVGKFGKEAVQGTLEFRDYANTINAYTTVASIAFMTKELTGFWPWDEENASLNPGDLRFELDDGRKLDVPFSKIANNVYRGAKYTGVIDALKAWKHGESDPVELGEEMLKGQLNFFLSRVGPPVRGVWQAARLDTPYLTSMDEGKFMKIMDPTRDPADKIMNRIKAGLQPFLPIFSKLPATKDMLGVREFSAKPETGWGTALRVATESTGFTSYIRDENYEIESMGWIAQKHEKEIRATAASIYRGALRQPPEKIKEYIMSELDDRFPDDAEKLEAIEQIMSMQEQRPDNLVEGVAKEKAMQQGKPGYLMDF